MGFTWLHKLPPLGNTANQHFRAWSWLLAAVCGFISSKCCYVNTNQAKLFKSQLSSVEVALMRMKMEQIGRAESVLWLKVGGSHPTHATLTSCSPIALGNASSWEGALGQAVQPQDFWLSKYKGIFPPSMETISTLGFCSILRCPREWKGFVHLCCLVCTWCKITLEVLMAQLDIVPSGFSQC